VGLASYPAIPLLTKTFDYTITCKVLALTTSTAPSNLSWILGVTTAATTTFAVTRTPNCPDSVSIYWLTSVPSFMTTSTAGTITTIGVSNPSYLDVGLYSLQIRSVVDGLTQDKSFTVEIIHPCRDATILPAANPFSSMTVVRNFDTSKTQTQSISTDRMITYSIFCPFTCNLVSPPVYLSLSGTATISVDVT
jgi:hypothetical protein